MSPSYGNLAGLMQGFFRGGAGGNGSPYAMPRPMAPTMGSSIGGMFGGGGGYNSHGNGGIGLVPGGGAPGIGIGSIRRPMLGMPNTPMASGRPAGSPVGFPVKRIPMARGY